MVVHPFGSDAAVSPYIGAGGGSYFWSLEEEGDFIASNDDIFFATFKDDGVAFGYYIAFPFAAEYLVSWGRSAGLEAMLNATDYKGAFNHHFPGVLKT